MVFEQHSSISQQFAQVRRVHKASGIDAQAELFLDVGLPIKTTPRMDVPQFIQKSEQ